jgi:hypothetical protein
MVYEDVLKADMVNNGDEEDSDKRCISLLVYLLWNDTGYRYLGEAIDKIVRVQWLANDYKVWFRKTVDGMVTKGETGNPHLDKVLRRSKAIRRYLKIVANPGEEGPRKYKSVSTDTMTFNDYRQAGEEQYERARPILRKGDHYMGVYHIGARSGMDLDGQVPPEVLQKYREIESPDEDENGAGVPPRD